MVFKARRPKPVRQAVLAEFFEELHEFGDDEDSLKKRADLLLEEFKAAPFSKKLAARYAWKQAFINAYYRDTNPKEVPVEDLHIIASLTSYDFPDTKYAERLKSPATAIRAYCVNCQGGQISAVRNCTNVVCPLFPFRMGTNPLYGKVLNADVEVTEDFEEEMPETVVTPIEEFKIDGDN